ncbi:hypothetical protein ABXM16_13725 [Enterococcus faecalis]
MTRYEESFKQMIVELNQTGRSVRGLAKEYGWFCCKVLNKE